MFLRNNGTLIYNMAQKPQSRPSTDLNRRLNLETYYITLYYIILLILHCTERQKLPLYAYSYLPVLSHSTCARIVMLPTRHRQTARPFTSACWPSNLLIPNIFVGILLHSVYKCVKTSYQEHRAAVNYNN